MECRLKNSTKAWNCQVRLRRKRDTDLDATSAGLDSKTNAREENFGPLLTNKTDLEHLIRRAQLAILNPGSPISQFVQMTEEEVEERTSGNDSQLQFSQDVVCLDITGPEVTNLSFIDLPGKRSLMQGFSSPFIYSMLILDVGIIAFDSEENVTLVEDMVKDHIKGNTLILLAITMKGPYW